MNEINFNKLVEMVDEFLEPFGLDSDFDADFCYDTEEERVYFSIMVTERSDRLFKKYIKDTFNFNVPSIFMMSLLHEVGHAETLDTLSRAQIDADHYVKDILDEVLENTPTNNPDYEDIYTQYFDLTIEKVATQWAVDYYKANRKRCDDFYSIFENALVEEYKRINLE